MKQLKDSQIMQREAEGEEHEQLEEDEEVFYSQDSYPEQSQLTAQPCIIEAGPFLQQIKNYIMEKTAIYNASFAWTLMIQDQADFNPDKLAELLDADQTWKKIIKYNEEYSLAVEFGQCMSCFQRTYLLYNSCGHLCCINCWESHLRSQYQSEGNLKLFPLCLKKQCNHYINYQLIAYLNQQSSSLEKLYANVLISKYCRINSSFKICPNLSCGKIINRSLCKDQIINCSCGLQVCLACGKQSHFPLECHDLQVWNSLKLVMKCFECQSIISKDGEDYFVECICEQLLCWRCENPWSDFCIDQNCFKKIKYVHSSGAIQEGKLLSFDNLEQTTHQVDKLTRSIKRVNSFCSDSQIQKLVSNSIIEIQAEIVNKLKNFIINAREFVKRCHIYIFFERNNAWKLREVMNSITQIAEKAHNYLRGILWMEYMSQKEFIEQKKAFINLVSEGNIKINIVKEGWRGE